MLVGSDVGSVHGEGAVAVADGQVSEDLIVSTVFFQDVDDVANRVRTGLEVDLAGIGAEKIALFDLTG